MAFWNQPRRGANFFNRRESADRFRAASLAGTGWVRLTFSKWQGAGRDFLIGDADRFSGIPPADLGELRRQLDVAHGAGLKVVLAPLTLPGARWRQHNDNRSDFRLWRDAGWHTQAAAFWRELASALRDHPAVAGYNILNEPHPELTEGEVEPERYDFRARAARVRDSAADLNALYATVVRAIRTVDARTPIVLDAGLYANPWAIAGLTPIADAAVLYAVHMYEPYVLTTLRQNKGRYAYPGTVEGVSWDRAALERYLTPVVAWQREHRVPSSRIIVAEFGCDRRVTGAASYLADLLDIFEARGWHWAFYAFREDTWDAMDYELGDGPTPPGYWSALEAGRTPAVRRRDNPLWLVLQRGLAR